MSQMKRMDFFCKNCLTLFVSGREKNAHFRAHYVFWPKIFLRPKHWKLGKTIKTVVSAKLPKTKNDTLFEKVFFFDMGEKWGFTNCVFEKLCSSESTSFIVFSAKHSSCNKTVGWNKQKIMNNCGLFLSMAKRCFFVFFQVLMLLWFVFCGFGRVAKVLKMLFLFSQCFGFLWGGLFLSIWVSKV